MLARFGNLSYLCNWSGKDPLGRRSVMLQTCGWKPEKFSSKTDNSRRAEQLPRIAWGCAPISCYQVFSGPPSGTGKGSPALLLWNEENDNN